MPRIAVPYLAGSVLGGCLLGLFLALLAALVGFAGSSGQLAIATLIAVYALAELTGRRLWRPNPKRQVAQDLLRTRYISTASFVFGLDLGNGWTTVQPTSAMLTFCLAATVLDPELAFASGVGFGMLRPLHLAFGWGLASVEELPHRFRLRVPLRGTIHVTSGAVGLVTAVVLIML